MQLFDEGRADIADMYDTMNDIPVRDHNNITSSQRQSAAVNSGDGGGRRTNQQRQTVSLWPRADLEDQYLRQYDENILLKKHARKQEEKIKRMATKLLRLVNDKKKMSQADGVKKGPRDIEMEETVEVLHEKIRELEKQNCQLKEKLLLAKQQMTQSTRRTPYGRVQSRINTGVAKPIVDPRLAKGIRVAGPMPPTSSKTMVQSSSPLPRYGHSLLEQTRAENQQLTRVIEDLSEQINFYEQDVEMLKEQMRIREAEFEEDLLKIKQQMSEGQRVTIQENIDVIRLQREVKEKSTKLTALQAQYSSLEMKLATVRGSHDEVLRQMERLNEQLKEEQVKVLSLNNQLHDGLASQRNAIELRGRITDLENECAILKESNEKLVNSAFDLEREREWRERESALKVQIAQLEATLRADVGEKGSILDQLTHEKESHETLEEEHRQLQRQYYEIKQKNDELNERLKMFSKDSAVDYTEIEEALLLVKRRKEVDSQQLDFLQKVDDERNKDLEKLVREMRAEHADTITELEKTRNMLIVQHKINKDYQAEVDAVSKKMEENKAEYEFKLEEYARLLDIRAQRIRKLELQLRDIAYGTRQYRVRPADDEGSEPDTIDETIHLERGENLFEITIKKVVLSPEAVDLLGEAEPNLFCTWEFYEFEIQSSPVIKSRSPEFSFTSQYVVKIDDFFLHYLQKDSCTLELHQCLGADYQTLAACQLQMRDIVDKSHGRLHGTAQLTGVVEGSTGVIFGTVEFSVRLRVPMEQALRLYKERCKALGYIESNLQKAEPEVVAMDTEAARRPADNVNELQISLLRCANLKSRSDSIQPSSYCVYKFFDFDDHDTTIVTGSNDPQFNDQRTYPVPMTADLDRYLKSQFLHVYVFDDTDTPDACYLGVAKIPLLPLAHNNPICGAFELNKIDGSLNGTIELQMKWQYSYLPPRAATRTPSQHDWCDTVPTSEGLAFLPGEEQALGEEKTRVVKQPTSLASPMAASTPMADRRMQRQPAEKQQPEIEVSLVNAEKPCAEQQNPHMAGAMKQELGNGKLAVHQMKRPLAPVRATPIRETAITEASHESSLVSEGTPVPGESLTVSEEEEDEESVTEMPPEDVTPLQKTVTLPLPSMKQQQQRIQVATDDEVSEDIISEDGEERQEPEVMLSEDSEGVVQALPSSRPGSTTTPIPSDVVTVVLSHLSFDENAPALQNDAVKMLFVEYRFLGVSPAETETPYSLPKPEANKNISFNFTKVFHVDRQDHYERRQYLANMLLPDDPDNGRVRFTVVSEPDDPEGDCEDVGVAFVSIVDILRNSQDVIDRDMPIYNVDDEHTRIGILNVTVKCLPALETIKEELPSSVWLEESQA